MAGAPSCMSHSSVAASAGRGPGSHPVTLPPPLYIVSGWPLCGLGPLSGFGALHTLTHSSLILGCPRPWAPMFAAALLPSGKAHANPRRSISISTYMYESIYRDMCLRVPRTPAQANQKSPSSGISAPCDARHTSAHTHGTAHMLCIRALHTCTLQRQHDARRGQSAHSFACTRQDAQKTG